MGGGEDIFLLIGGGKHIRFIGDGKHIRSEEKDYFFPSYIRRGAAEGGGVVLRGREM